MSSELKGILIGGLLPALLYGVTGIFQDERQSGGCRDVPDLSRRGYSNRRSSFSFPPPRTPDLDSTGLLLSDRWPHVFVGRRTDLCGVDRLWSRHLSAHTAVLITVVLGLLIFAEYRDLHAVRLLIGTVLLIGGGLLVASS
jgi:hypothetical protein